MPDFNINITGDAASAVQAAQQTASALGNAADETARYESALRQMEIASRAAEQAQRNLANAAAASSDESARYQAALEQMSGRGGPEKSKALNPFGDGWMAGMAERRAALKKEGQAGAEAMDTIAAATSKVTMRKEELGRALGALNRAFPGLGNAARAAMNPITLAVTGAVLMFRYAKGEIDKFNEAIQDIKWEGFSRGAKKSSDAVAEIRDMAKEAEDASARLMDVFNAQQSAEAKVDAARKRVELAQARGIQDPAQRAMAEAEIEERYARRDLAREERGRQMKISEQERRAANLRDQENRIGGRLYGLRDEQGRVGTPEEIQKELEFHQAESAKAKEAYLSGADRLSGLGRRRLLETIAGFALGGATGAMTAWKLRGASNRAEEENVAGLEGIYRREQGMASRLQGRLPYAQRLSSEVDFLQQNYTGVRQSRQGIESMLPTQRTVAAIEGQAGRAAFGMEHQERAINARNEASSAAQKLLQELIGAIESNKGVDQRVAQELESWRQWKATMEQRLGGQRR